DFATGGGAYIRDDLVKVDPSDYSISGDSKYMLCNYQSWDWRARTDADIDIYYEVRYYYKATIAEDSGLLSTQYKKDEHEHIGTVGAVNSQIKAENLGFQLYNPYDNSWTFNYGTDYNNWNYQFTDVTSGNPYIIFPGDFQTSGISSVDSFSQVTEFENYRTNYGTISYQDDIVSASAELSQFATGQDFYSSNYQDLNDNSYIDGAWVEDLQRSMSIDFRTDLPKYQTTYTYQPEIPEGNIMSSTGSKTAINRGVYSYYEITRSGTAGDLYYDILVPLEHNEDSDSIKSVKVDLSVASGFDTYSDMYSDSNLFNDITNPIKVQISRSSGWDDIANLGDVLNYDFYTSWYLTDFF
ncbi:unnamed protein product, partial [marine sediment metagenome]